MNTGTLKTELKKYGRSVVLAHIKAKLSGNKSDMTDYVIKKHSASSYEDLEKELAGVFREAMGYDMDFEHPETFCQKLYWMRLYDATPEKAVFADKYLVRDIVEEKLGKGHLINLLGVWDSPDDIDFNTLPERFVLKTNHGCGYNIIVKNKAELDIKEAKKRLRKWLNTDYSMIHPELQYHNIPRKIIAEEYMEQMADGDLFDYKIHCFDGVPFFCQVLGGRTEEDHSGWQIFYDMDWKRSVIDLGNYPHCDKEIEKPACWEEMKKAAGILSKGVDYLRVDLYEADNTYYLGELTCTPAGGNFPKLSPEGYDRKLGDMIPLGDKYKIKTSRLSS